MSDQITMKSNANGTFQIDTPYSSRTASIKQDGGATIVDFTQATPDDELHARGYESGLMQIMQDAGGSIEMGADGRIRSLAPQTHQQPTRTADDRPLLDTLKDAQGRPCSDFRRAIADPESYTVDVKGTKCSLAAAQRLGWVNVDGSGNLNVSVDNLIQDTVQKPAQRGKAETIEVNDVDTNLLMEAQLKGNLGVKDPASLMAAYLQSGPRAVAAAVDAAGGRGDVGHISRLIEDSIESFAKSAAGALEANGLVKPGQGADCMLNLLQHTDARIAQRVFAGMLRGDKSCFVEAVRRFQTGDRW